MLLLRDCRDQQEVRTVSEATTSPVETAGLTKYAWLSIAAAVVTIALKTGAYLLTGSVGLLSDAAESVVNLVAAVIALVALTVAARPADDNHHYGHGKAEYFSRRHRGPDDLRRRGAHHRVRRRPAAAPAGAARASASVWRSPGSPSLVNGAVGWLLIRVGRQHRSVTLDADGKHLMTDVWTSVGVIVGVGLVASPAGCAWTRSSPSPSR